MFEIDSLVSQVRRNCDITDARNAGLHSICGLALRLRDLFKWEKGLEPWVEKDAAEVLEWIGLREERWDELAGEEFEPILLEGKTYAPFGVRPLNLLLQPRGLFYGAGYVYSLRPTFFLASIEERRRVQGYQVYILGRELARDLLTLPALAQDDSIVVRLESGRLFLWNQIFFARRSSRSGLALALSPYGLDPGDFKGIQNRLNDIFADEMEVYIYHELGEIKENVFDRETWRKIIAAFPHSPIELLARSVKDLLADTNPFGMLRHIIQGNKSSSLGFYMAFLDGIRKILSPELVTAFQGFEPKEDWKGIEQAVDHGYKRAVDYATAMSEIYRSGNGDLKQIRTKMSDELLRPLGIV